jgi:hypothetical protein
MSSSSDQSLKELASCMRSIDTSLKTIAEAVKNRSRVTVHNYNEGTKPDDTSAGRPARGDDYVGPYGSGPVPYT